MKLNISAKILCSVLGVSFLFMASWGTVNYFVDKAASSRVLRRSTETTAERLGQSLINPLWNLDYDEIDRIIAFETKNEQIKGIVVRADDGQVLVGRIRQGGVAPDGPALDKALTSSFSATATTIAKESKVLGTVTVYADGDRLRSELRKRLYLSASELFLLCICLTVVLYLILRRTIITPLQLLEESVGRISIDNLEMPVPVSGDDEIGRLANRFRGMTAELRSSIDQRNEVNEQLLQAQKMEAIGMLVGGIAHDFNNILCAVVGSAEMLLFLLEREQLEQPEKIWRHLKSINDASGRATDLIRQLLTLSMKQELALTAVDLRDTVRHVTKLLRSSQDKSISLKVDMPDKRAMVSSDPLQIEQVLLNLCINACHAMTIMRPEGTAWGGDLRISLKQLAADCLEPDRPGGERGPCWLLSVSDTGVGMDAATLQNIFTPFFTTKQKGTGTGLGLSMAFSIVTKQHGSITVDSTPGLGTTFHIILPALQESERSEADTHAAVERSPLPSGSGLILLVDDDEGIRENCSQYLTVCGYTVLTARDGAEGIELARQHGSDIRLVVLDMIMPVMSGSDALPGIKAAAPSAQVILSSGFRHDPRVLDLLAKGVVDGFIQKPFTLNCLALTIQAKLSSLEGNGDAP